MGRYLLLWLLGVPLPILVQVCVRRSAPKLEFQQRTVIPGRAIARTRNTMTMIGAMDSGLRQVAHPAVMIAEMIWN
jgi:hypothetical protein